jgi:hypothetical protein
VSACTCSGVYHTAEPAPDQRGFAVRRPDPPLLLRPLLLPEEYEGDEYDP